VIHRAAALAALALLAPAAVRAQETAPASAIVDAPAAPPAQMAQPAPLPPPADGPRVSLTISPIHLLFPMLEVTAELRVQDRLGLALIGGLGHVLGVRVQELGAQARWYVTGHFARGLHLGVEALYLRADLADLSTTVSGEGLSVGPFVGYKLGWPSGFTLDGQAGVALVAARARSSGSTSSGGRTTLPLLNLNLGWTF
jgi:hypothetical protein